MVVGSNDKGQCDVSKWKDIVAVSAGGEYTVGLKSDGTVVAAGKNDRGQCDVAGWKLFKTEQEKEADYTGACALQESGEENKLAEAASIFKSLKNYKDSAERAKACSITFLNNEKTALQTELANLKGISSGKRRKRIESRLAEIESELKKLK